MFGIGNSLCVFISYGSSFFISSWKVSSSIQHDSFFQYMQRLCLDTAELVISRKPKSTKVTTMIYMACSLECPFDSENRVGIMSLLLWKTGFASCCLDVGGCLSLLLYHGTCLVARHEHDIICIVIFYSSGIHFQAIHE